MFPMYRQYYNNLKSKVFKSSQVKPKYSWEVIDTGLFKDTTLYLPIDWSYKVIDCVHEKEIFSLINQIANKSNVFFDIGGHYGWFSIAWICSGGQQAVTFEPSIANASILEQTIIKNGYQKNIQLKRIALGSVTKEEELYIFRGDSSRNFINPDFENKNKFNKEKVKTYRLDDLRDTLKSPDLIKIDVEGFESEVLLGASELIKSSKPLVIVEIHDLKNAIEVSAFFSNLNYKIELLGYKGKKNGLPIVLFSPK